MKLTFCQYWNSSEIFVEALTGRWQILHEIGDFDARLKTLSWLVTYASEGQYLYQAEIFPDGVSHFIKTRLNQKHQEAWKQK